MDGLGSGPSCSKRMRLSNQQARDGPRHSSAGLLLSPIASLLYVADATQGATSQCARRKLAESSGELHIWRAKAGWMCG